MAAFDTLSLALAAGMPLLAAAALYLWCNARPSDGVPSVPAAEYLPGGLMYTVFSDSGRSNQMFRELVNKYGSIFYARLGPSKTLFTAYPGDMLRVLTKVNDFSRPARELSTLGTMGKGSLFLMPNDLHRRVRKEVRGMFSPALLEGFWASLNTASRVMARDLDKPLDGVGGDGSAVLDVSALFQAMAVRTIFNVAFGANYSEDALAEYGKRSSRLLQCLLRDFLRQPLSGSWLGEFLGMRQEVRVEGKYQHTIFRKLVRDRRGESAEDKARRAPDLLDALVGLENAVEETEEAAEEVIVSNCLVFAVAGSHTTAAASAWAVYYICGDPKVYQNVQEEIDRVCGGEAFKYEHISQLTYLKQVWNETQRLQPAGSGFFRTAECDVELPDSGVRVAAGAQVFCMMLATHRDPTVWTRAEEFVPERWDPVTGDGFRVRAGAYTPFSAGQKNCPGSFLADVEGVLMLAELFREHNVELAVPREEVVLVAGWANSACTHDPAGPPGNMSRGVPIRIRRRQGRCGQ